MRSELPSNNLLFARLKAPRDNSAEDVAGKQICVNCKTNQMSFKTIDLVYHFCFIIYNTKLVFQVDKYSHFEHYLHSLQIKDFQLSLRPCLYLDLNSSLIT